ncbi:MAG: 50S ribosomal protein L25/general stress protein Ctc [Arachnia sp.]
MAADATISAQIRTEFGKGAARRLRRAGQTPAVLYGHGTDPVHLALPAQETFLALRTANALLEINVEGQKPVLALPKQIQRDPIFPAIEHIDLILVKAGEKVVVDVPLSFVGEAEKGAIVNHETVTISVHAPATDIPTEFEVSVEGLAVGDQILASGIALPKDVELAVDGETLIVSAVAPATEAPAEDEADAEAAE